MKKLFATIFVLVIGFVILASVSMVEAQPILVTNRCCDNSGVVRCVINPTPVGNSCFCYGQGYGYAC